MPPVHRFDVDNAAPEAVASYLLRREWQVSLQNKYAYSDEEMGRLMVSVDLDHELYRETKSTPQPEEEGPATVQDYSNIIASTQEGGYTDIRDITMENTSQTWAEREDLHQRTIPDLAWAIRRGCKSLRFMVAEDSVLVYKVIEAHLRYKAHEISHNIQDPPPLLLEALELLEALAKFLHPQVIWTLNQRHEMDMRRGISTAKELAPLVPTFGFGDASKWVKKTPEPAPLARTPAYKERIKGIREVKEEHTLEGGDLFNSDIFKDRINRW